MEHRDAHRVEARLVRGAVAVPPARDVERRVPGGAIDQVLPLGRGVGAERDQLVLPQPSDHVEIDHGRDAGYRDRRVLDEPGGPRQTDLLAGEERDQDAPSIRDAGERAPQRLPDEHGPDGARSVVVGAVVNRVLVRAHGVLSAIAQMVVVGADHDVFVLQSPLARDHSGQVLRFLEARAQGDRPRDSGSRGGDRARLEIAIHVLLEAPEIDPRRPEPVRATEVFTWITGIPAGLSGPSFRSAGMRSFPSSWIGPVTNTIAAAPRSRAWSTL